VAVLSSRPTASVSGAAGSLQKPARALARHHAPRSRPSQGPRQRRPLHAMLGGCFVVAILFVL